MPLGESPLSGARNESIKYVIFEFGRLSIVGWFLRLWYRLQLNVFVRLCRSMPSVRAVILRRSEVLLDISPGISDFDLTIILNDHTYRFRFLRMLFPVINGLLIATADELTHNHHLLGSTGTPRLLYGAPGFQMPNRQFNELAISYSIMDLMKMAFWPKFLGIGAREIVPHFAVARASLKLESLFLQLKTQRVLPLRYPAAISEITFSGIQAYGILSTQFGNLSSEVIDRQTMPMPIKVHSGPLEHLGRIHRDISELVLEAFNQAPVPIAEISLSLFRLYHFAPLIIIVLDSNPSEREWTDLGSLLSPLGDTIQSLDLEITPSFPLVFSPDTWRFWKTADPIFAMLHSQISIPFGTSSSPLIHSIKYPEKADWEFELAESISAFQSSFRSGPTHYMMDLLLGRLIPTRLALTEQKIFVSFQKFFDDYLSKLSWTQNQRDILDLYASGNHQALDRIPIHKWVSVFNPFMDTELKIATSVLRK